MGHRWCLQGPSPGGAPQAEGPLPINGAMGLGMAVLHRRAAAPHGPLHSGWTLPPCMDPLMPAWTPSSSHGPPHPHMDQSSMHRPSSSIHVSTSKFPQML